MKIFAFHLLNDYSGSPRVLMQLVKGWVKNNVDVTIVTAGGRDGFLSHIEGVRYISFWYVFLKQPLLRLFNFMLSQVLLFCVAFRKVKKGDIIYVNTVLPFGAALLGKLKGCRVIYHLHETSVKPKILKKFLFFIVNTCATEVIFVSAYLLHEENTLKPKKHLLYNAIETDFLQQGLQAQETYSKNNNILMICSLKEYKGVFEFLSLAGNLKNYNFILVVNSTHQQIEAFFKNVSIPGNLTIFPTQTDTHPFYRWADVIVNLSRKDEWIETFGLTILEGMAYGLPAIVPEVGGIAELVEEGVNGYHIDSRQVSTISSKIKNLLNDNSLFEKMRYHSREKIYRYTEDRFITNSLRILHNN